MSLLRRRSTCEALWLLGAAALTVLVFSLTPLDISAARLFFRPLGVDHWPLLPLWPRSAWNGFLSLLASLLLVIGLLSTLVGKLRGDEFRRIGGIFVILSVILAPAVGWNRPSPQDVSEFGGTYQYPPLLAPGPAADSSLYGQCSVGFLFASGWWLWRRRRAAWARASLLLGMAAGLAMGLESMARGEHFLSDVVWSALLVLAVCHVLYYYVLRLQQDDVLRPPGKDARPWRTPARRVILVLLVLAAGARLSHREQLSPQALDSTARAADRKVQIADYPRAQTVPADTISRWRDSTATR